MDARAKLIDIAAFLDRTERAGGDADFRIAAPEDALGEPQTAGPPRAKRGLLAFSDMTEEPIPAATTKAACGAWPEKEAAR